MITCLRRARQGKGPCGAKGAGLFFPVGVTGEAIPHIAAAKAVCAGCEVQEACLAFALTTNQDYGVWGGLDAEERRHERRRWRRQADGRPVAS